MSGVKLPKGFGWQRLQREHPRKQFGKACELPRFGQSARIPDALRINKGITGLAPFEK
jgi:hypothetical protein